MFDAERTAVEKRRMLRGQLDSGRLLRFPGAFSPLIAQLIERIGFEGVYVSGAVLSANLGLPDVGLTTLTEVSERAREIASVTTLPTIVDADTGFGSPLNAARTVRLLETAGLAGCHFEDQRLPKRCGHLEDKQLVTPEEMERTIRAAVQARRDPNFAIIARTDARAIEGIDGAIARGRRYLDAGADVLFAEALHDRDEIAAVRRAIDQPLLINLTEFGKTELLPRSALEELGVNLVIYPVTTLRLALGAVRRGLEELDRAGTQAGLVEEMMTRADLYELIHYEAYSVFDRETDAFFNREGT